MTGWIVVCAVVLVTAIRLWQLRCRRVQPAKVAGTTHVVIDMQQLFLRLIRDRDRTVFAVIAEMEAAKQRGEAIVVLHLTSVGQWNGPIDPDVLAAVEGYTRSVVVEKFRDNGAPWVADACLEHGFGNEVFRLYGLNAEACVLKTALGLRRRFPLSRVEVVKQACSSAARYRWSEYYLWPGAWRIRFAGKAEGRP